MNPTNTGSFGAAIGGVSPELQAAMASRQGGASVGAPISSQVSQAAPTADIQTQAPAAPTASAPMPPMGGSPEMGAPMPAESAPVPQMPFESPEAKMIVGSLGNRLKALSKLQGVE